MTVLREAANILDISEYVLLEHAYRHWYGKSPSLELINRTFSAYLTGQEPPHWARHYALDVISRFDAEMSARRNILQLLRLLFWDFKHQSTQNNHSLAA